jgi:hypothetical protein
MPGPSLTVFVMTAPLGWMKSTFWKISEDIMKYHGLGSYLCRIVALTDFPDTVRGLVWLLNKVCHPDDFVLLVIFDHFGLLDDRHEILGMADLAL